jgi:diguanylate cyclase (GGDEF)-like protein/PAS domain S-box-containing protein
MSDHIKTTLNSRLTNQLAMLQLSLSKPINLADWQALLEVVSTIYDEIDTERELTKHAMEVATAEMQSLYEMLSQERDSLEQHILSRTAELAASEARFRALTTLSTDWFWEQDADFRFTSLASSSGKSVFFNPPEVLGKTRWELTGLSPIEQSWEAHRALLDRHEVFSDLIYSYESENGNVGYMHVAGEPIFNENHEFVGYQGVARDITKERTTQDRIYQLAHFDVLTGLMNRTMLNDQLEKEISECMRHNHSMCVLFIDLDGFKSINDTHTHATGDHVLREIALRLKDTVRNGDYVARLGGDEFVVVLTHASAEDAERIAKRMLAQIANPIVLGDAQFQLKASIGISLYPEDGNDCATLLQHADLAMYRAKEDNGNRLSFFSATMQEAAKHRRHITNGLKSALQNREFKLFWQAKVDARSRAVVGVEALIRWFHPTEGMIAPNVFIPIAEENGLIVPIGRWVMLEACRQIKAWENQGLRLLASINVSARQFREESFIDDVKTCIEIADCDPSLLEIEVTESMVMHDPDKVILLLHDLKSLGIKLSLDDFGTGHSSLAWLRKFPIDTIKIDRSFVSSLAVNKDDQAICKAVLALADSLDLLTVAEGVETAEQADLLDKLGCDQLQGFYFYKPMPVDQLTPKLLDQVGRVVVVAKNNVVHTTDVE